MRYLTGAILAACFILPAQAQSAQTAGEAANSFHAALKRGDRDAAAALLSPAILIYESGYVERSKEEYMSHHLGGDVEFAAATARKVLRHAETSDGNTAVIMEETETTGSFKGKPVHSLGTETLVLQGVNGKWTITHAHWSSRKAK